MMFVLGMRSCPTGRANLQEWVLVLYGTTRPPPFDVQTRTKPRYNSLRPSAPPTLRSLPPLPPPTPPPPAQLPPPPPRKGKKPGRMKGGVGLRGRQQQVAILTTQSKPKVQTPTRATTQAPVFVASTPASSRGITIMLAPPSQVQPRVPAAFQRYSKIQQLVPYSHEDADVVDAVEAVEARTTTRRPAPTRPGPRSQRPTPTPTAPSTRARQRPAKIGSRQRHQGEGKTPAVDTLASRFFCRARLEQRPK